MVGKRGSAIEQVESFEIPEDRGMERPISSSECVYNTQEVNGKTEVIESCKSNEYTSGSVQVPKWSVPYQVQLISNKKGESDEKLRELMTKDQFSNLELWQMRHLCSGAFIHEDWVLTAAHCLVKGIPPDGYGIRFAVDSISENLDDYIPVEKYFIRDDYVGGPLENDIMLMKLAKGNEPRTFPKFYSPISSNKMTPWQSFLSKDGRRLVTIPPYDIKASYFTVWNSKTGDKIYEQTRRDDVDRYLQLDNESGLVFGVDEIGAWIFNIASDRRIRRISGTDKSYRIFWLKNANKFATYSRFGEFRILDVGTLNVLDRFSLRDISPPLNEQSISGISYLRPGHYVFYTDRGDPLFFDRSANTVIKIDPGLQNIISPDGSHMVRHIENRIDLIQTMTGQVVKSIPLSDGGHNMWRGDDGQHFILEESGKNTRVFSIDAFEENISLKSRKFSIWQVSDNTVYAMSSKNEFTIFDLISGKKTGEVKIPENYRAANWHVFDRGHKLIMWLPEGRSIVWNLRNDKKLFELNHSLPVTNVKISPDEKYILSYSEYGPVDIWSAVDGKAVTRLFHRGAQDVIYNPDQDMVITWGARGLAKSWVVGPVMSNGSSGSRAKQLAEFDIKPNSMAFDLFAEVAKIKFATSEPADGTTLFAYGWGKTREVATHEPVSVLRGISFPKISDQECRRIFDDRRLEFGADEMCAFDSVRHTCKGDSGGPIVSGHTLVGITSWGDQCKDGGGPSVMVNVAHFQDWIVDTVCQNSAADRKPEFCAR